MLVLLLASWTMWKHIECLTIWPRWANWPNWTLRRRVHKGLHCHISNVQFGTGIHDYLHYKCGAVGGMIAVTSHIFTEHDWKSGGAYHYGNARHCPQLAWT